MQEKPNENPQHPLPQSATDFIRQVTKKMRYRRKVREDVQAELTAHFEDALQDCENSQDREQKAARLVEEFGDAGFLAVLCRRAKKRCRPLWKKVVIRSAQALGVLVLYLFACSLPLFLGKPTVRVNYATWLSDRARPTGQDAENARQYYDRAAGLYVKPPETLSAKRKAPDWTVRDCNETDMALLADWLAENEPAFDMLKKGANTAHYWPVYDVSVGEESSGSAHFAWMEANVVPEAMEPLAGYRQIALAMKDRIACRVRQGAIDEAIRDSLTVLRFGKHMEGKGLLIEQMVGVAIEAVGTSVMYAVLQQGEVPLDVLTRVQDELTTIFDKDRPPIDLAGEKAFWYDKIQRTFTDDGHGGGRALRHGILFAAGDWKSNLAGIFLFNYPDRREAIAMVEGYFDRAQEYLRTPPDENEQPAEHGDDTGAPAPNLMFSIMAPAHERVGQLAWRARTGETALVTTMAILRYKAQTGSYPARLEELVAANLLERVPDDPFGEGPLTYRRTPDGFLLYSWGENLQDDGGQQGTGQDGQPRLWANNGDCVFWPVDP